MIGKNDLPRGYSQVGEDGFVAEFSEDGALRRLTLGVGGQDQGLLLELRQSERWGNYSDRVGYQSYANGEATHGSHPTEWNAHLENHDRPVVMPYEDWVKSQINSLLEERTPKHCACCHSEATPDRHLIPGYRNLHYLCERCHRYFADCLHAREAGRSLPSIESYETLNQTQLFFSDGEKAKDHRCSLCWKTSPEPAVLCQAVRSDQPELGVFCSDCLLTQTSEDRR